jgi:hypothetical protein
MLRQYRLSQDDCFSSIITDDMSNKLDSKNFFIVFLVPESIRQKKGDGKPSHSCLDGDFIPKPIFPGTAATGAAMGISSPKVLVIVGLRTPHTRQCFFLKKHWMKSKQRGNTFRLRRNVTLR